MEAKLRGVLLHEKGDSFQFYKNAYSVELLQLDRNDIRRFCCNNFSKFSTVLKKFLMNSCCLVSASVFHLSTMRYWTTTGFQWEPYHAVWFRCVLFVSLCGQYCTLDLQPGEYYFWCLLLEGHYETLTHRKEKKSKLKSPTLHYSGSTSLCSKVAVFIGEV